MNLYRSQNIAMWTIQTELLQNYISRWDPFTIDKKWKRRKFFLFPTC